MAKFTAIIFTAGALLAGVQAQCPPNTLLCGSEILDVFQCATEEYLTDITPFINPAENIRTDIYPTNSSGVPQIPSADCSATGCSNSNQNTIPPQPAHCF